MPVDRGPRPRTSAVASATALVVIGAFASALFAAPIRSAAQAGDTAPPSATTTPDKGVLVVPPTTTTLPTTAPPATTTTLDLLPPESPPTRPTAPPPPSTTSTSTSTTIPVASPSGDASLAPVCASAVGARPAAGKRCRIIAYYGTPAAPTMGILGRLPRAELPGALAADVAMWSAADPSVTTRCAFEVIATVALASKGPSGLYRSRISAPVLDQMIALARANGCLTILDLQVGQSSVPVELPFFLPWLAAPDVHLALDPEWDMPPGVVPGKAIGSMEATDINSAIASMTGLVRSKGLPPKLVIVHRFRDFMIVDPTSVHPTPEVRLLVNMDGFGPPPSKIAVYGRVRLGLATDLTGFKLFTKNDTPMLRPIDVLPLQPPPMFVNYQ